MRNSCPPFVSSLQASTGSQLTGLCREWAPVVKQAMIRVTNAHWLIKEIASIAFCGTGYWYSFFFCFSCFYQLVTNMTINTITIIIIIAINSCSFLLFMECPNSNAITTVCAYQYMSSWKYRKINISEKFLLKYTIYAFKQIRKSFWELLPYFSLLSNFKRE